MGMKFERGSSADKRKNLGKALAGLPPPPGSSRGSSPAVSEQPKEEVKAPLI